MVHRDEINCGREKVESEKIREFCDRYVKKVSRKLKKREEARARSAEKSKDKLFR